MKRQVYIDFDWGEFRRPMRQNCARRSLAGVQMLARYSFTGGGIQMRGNRTCDPNSGAPHNPHGQWFNPSCFTQPANYTFGNEHRNAATPTWIYRPSRNSSSTIG